MYYTSLLCQTFPEVALLQSRYDTHSTNSEAITAYSFDGNNIKIDTIVKRVAPKKGKQ